MDEAREEINPVRPHRHYPRVKKRPPFRYSRPNPRRTYPPTHRVAIVQIALSLKEAKPVLSNEGWR